MGLEIGDRVVPTDCWRGSFVKESDDFKMKAMKAMKARRSCFSVGIDPYPVNGNEGGSDDVCFMRPGKECIKPTSCDAFGCNKPM